MANLALSETIQRRFDEGYCKVELDSMISLFIQLGLENEKLAFALTSFFANIIEIDKVKEALLEVKDEEES